jgi:D-beta-D-heptose 7-phosphate kinase/D-beta-D-heptose 1-phosphate adenosyltransferase
MKGHHIDGISSRSHFVASEVTRVPKEWGEEQWIVNKEYCGKKLILKKNRRCSMHSHKKKDEVFYLQSGKVLLEMSGKKYTLLPGDFVHVKPNAPHRFTGLQDSEIIEFSTTHDEEDSYRTEFSGHSDPKRFERQSAIIHSFKNLSVLVLGDVMVDRYISGRIDRISPEAPVPVIHAVSERDVLGGAANSAANMSAFGARVTLLGVVGNHGDGKRLKDMLKKQKIVASLLEDASRPTIVKERITSLGGQQIARIDREAVHSLSSSLEKRLIAILEKEIKKADAVLISDYAKGLITPTLLRTVLKHAKKIPVVLDPKPHGHLTLAEMKGCTLITPNMHEAYGLVRDHHASSDVIGSKLSKATGGAVLLTRGAEGLDVFTHGKKILHLDSCAPQVVDVSGAGDTVAAIATMALGGKSSLEDSAELANTAASIVVQKRGTATLTAKELLDVL